jgi:hypothetical protein
MNSTEFNLLLDLKNEVQKLRAEVKILTSPGQLRQKFWTTEQVMDFLSMSRNTVYKNGAQLGGHKVGRQWRFKPELVENFKGEL